MPTKEFKDPKKALATLQEANDTFIFKIQTELPSEADWTGRTNQPGRLRLIALTPKSIHVATVNLKNK